MDFISFIYYRNKIYRIEAIFIKRMLLLNPINKEALQNLAGLYYNTGNYLKAEIYYKKALELDPEDLKNLEFFMNMYHRMGNTKCVNEIKKIISDLKN